MNRAGFLKSLAVLVAAPQLLQTAAAQSNTLPKGCVCKSYMFKLTKEMREDAGYMEHLFLSRASFVWKGCLAKGINLEEEFDYVIGYNGDDFAHDLFTCKITQW